MPIDFTPELIAGVAGMALSWLFSWFPGLRTWYAALKTEIKSAIMLSLLALTSGTIYFLILQGVLQVTEPVTLWKLVSIFFLASLLNQTTYSITPLPKDVVSIKTDKVRTRLEEPK